MARHSQVEGGDGPLEEEGVAFGEHPSLCKWQLQLNGKKISLKAAVGSCLGVLPPDRTFHRGRSEFLVDQLLGLIHL